MRTKELLKLSKLVEGLQYNDPRATEILDREDWAQHWPEVKALSQVVEDSDDGYFHGDTADLIYTGEVLTSDDRGWLNVEDMAAIRID